MTIRANRPAERGGSQEYRRNTKAQCAGIDLGALAAGRWAVEYDLRTAPDSFVKHWEYLRDALQKLEHDFGPSDNWK